MPSALNPELYGSPGQDSASGFVLAGGRSSRMGSDKALVRLHGRPLVEIALEILRAAGVPARIAGARSSMDSYAEVVSDDLDAGPLGGVVSALSASPSRWNLFLPVDMPLLPPSLLQCLLRRAAVSGTPVTAVRLNGGLEPFPVVLDRTVLPLIRQRLAAGQRVCRAAWESIPGELGSTLDAPPIEMLLSLGHCSDARGLPPVDWFQSANTPADLARVERLTSQVL